MKSLKAAGKSLVRILPMVFIILIVIALFLGFVPSDQISMFVGEQSRIMGVLLVGAKISNVWACIKVPREMVELQFLGIRFMLLRLSLTVIFVVKVVEWGENRKGTKSIEGVQDGC